MTDSEQDAIVAEAQSRRLALRRIRWKLLAKHYLSRWQHDPRCHMQMIDLTRRLRAG